MEGAIDKWKMALSSVNFGQLTTTVSARMLVHPKSTMCVLCMLTYLSSGHVTLLWGKFQPPNVSPNWTYSTGQTHVGLCPKLLVVFCFLFSGV